MRDNPILRKKKMLITAPFSFKNKDHLHHGDLVICLITNSLVIGMNYIRIRAVHLHFLWNWRETIKGKEAKYFLVQQALDLNGQFFSHLFLNYLWIYCIFFGLVITMFLISWLFTYSRFLYFFANLSLFLCICNVLYFLCHSFVKFCHSSC